MPTLENDYIALHFTEARGKFFARALENRLSGETRPISWDGFQLVFASGVKVSIETLDFEEFLQVFLPTAEMGAGMPNTRLLSFDIMGSASTKLSGVQIDDDVENKIVLFPGGETTMKVPAVDLSYDVITAQRSHHIVFGLEAGSVYSVRRPKGDSFNVKASEMGTLE